MSDPKDTSTGKPVSAKEYVLAAMFDDLGVGRMEDLATDETEHDFRPQPRPQLSTTQQNRISDSAAAQNFRAAMQKGDFQDDDYYAVKNLDSIADGNLHREKRLGVQNGQKSSKGGPKLIEQIRTIKKSPFPYNPEFPTYHGRHKVTKSFPHVASSGYRHAQVIKPGPGVSPFRGHTTPKTLKSEVRMSSLGGVIPEGATVKRYEPIKKVAESTHAESNGTNGTSASGSSTTRQTVRTQNDRESESGARQYPKGPGSSVGTKPEQLLNHLHNGRPFKEPVNRTASRSSGAAAATQPKQTATVTNAQPKQTTTVTNAHPKGQVTIAQPKQTITVTNGHPKGQAATAQHKVTATVTNGRPKDQAATPAAPAKSMQQVTPLQVGPSMTAMEARKTFFERSVNVKTFKDNKRVSIPGKTSIYEVAERAVTVWELIIGQEEVMLRKDIRELARWFQTLNRTTICYPEGPKGVLQAQDLEFEDLETARELLRVIEDQKKLRAQSSEPKFEQVQSPQPEVKQVQAPQPEVKQVQAPQPKLEQVQSPQPTFEPLKMQPPEPHEHPPTYADHQGSITSEDLIDFGEEPSSPQALKKESSLPQASNNTLIDLSDFPEATVTTKQTTLSRYLEELEKVFSKQRVDDQELECAYLDMEATSFDHLSEHISQDALKFLYGLSKDAYDGMIQKVTSMERPNELTHSPLGQARRSSSSTFKVVWEHLKQYHEYRQLTSDDQKMVQSVVYARVLHAHGRIVRSRSSLLKLKPRGAPQPCPDEIQRLNELVKSGSGESCQPTATYIRLPEDASLQGWQNFASSSQSSQGSSNSASLKRDGFHANQPSASKVTTQAKSWKVAQTPNPAPPQEGSSNKTNLKAKAVTSNTSHLGFDDGETEAPVREPSAWDLIDTDETVKPKTYSTTSWATTSSESTTQGQPKPVRTLRDSQWAKSSRSEHSPNTSFRLDRAFSGRSDARPELYQAPRSSSHVRTNTETTDKSDMSKLANQMESAPSNCAQS